MHIFPDSMFLDPYLRLLRAHLPEQYEASRFYVHGRRHLPALGSERMTIVESRKTLLEEWTALLRSDRIIWHSLHWLDRELLLFMVYPRPLARSTWVIWGADLYNKSQELQADRSVAGRTRLAVFRRLVSRFDAVATLIPGDYEHARRVFSVRGRHLTAIYPDSTPCPQLLPARPLRDGEPLRLLVGNSAVRANLHEDILLRLSAYKDYHLEVVVPLSYGDARYAEEVCRLGKSLLGAKFTPVLTWMAPEQYAALLDSVDVGVFNHKRQQALGNIFYLIQAGKRVFVRRDSPTWEFLTGDLGIEVGDACRVGSLRFDELCAPVDGRANHVRMAAFWGTENQVRAWRTILG